MRVSNPFKILGKVDTIIWNCLIQLLVFIAVMGFAGALSIFIMTQK